MPDTLLELRDVRKYFQIGGGIFSSGEDVHAVDGVNISIERGKTLGLVGESGCGKTTLGRVILRLIELSDGAVYFDGENLSKMDKERTRKLRRNMQIVFQDPHSSLDPRMTVKAIIGEPLSVHAVAKGRELRNIVLKLLERVGLNPNHLNRFPHEFSGGQRQRIGISRALALNPKFIVLDEPTSSLDVSVQAQILNLLKDLQEELGLTYLLISHDLSVVKHMSHKIAVMYVGKIMEVAKKEDLFKETLHPYTQALLSAIPIPDPHFKGKRIVLKGDVPSPVNPPSGCRFHPRCKNAKEICTHMEPKLIEVKNEHLVACHLCTRAKTLVMQ